jgi:bifunctional DNA-binding transcriptional regulator/antitoxin component of YhaV-PrlF toxin-antitoxin module
MCAYLDEVISQVKEFVQEDKMFTAWDVTCELRKKSSHAIKHFEVKRDVQKMFQDGSMPTYNRTIADLPNVSPQPWVYHPHNADASLYSGYPVDSNNQLLLPPPTDDEFYRFDSTGRLCIPANLARQAGLDTGDDVYLYQDGDYTVVTKTTTLPLSTVLKVDKNDNVRIRSGTLARFLDFQPSDCFEITGDNDSVKVKKH